MKYLYRLLYLIITWLYIAAVNLLMVLWHFDLNHKIRYKAEFFTITVLVDLYEDYPSSVLRWFESLNI